MDTKDDNADASIEIEFYWTGAPTAPIIMGTWFAALLVLAVNGVVLLSHGQTGSAISVGLCLLVYVVLSHSIYRVGYHRGRLHEATRWARARAQRPRDG